MNDQASSSALKWQLAQVLASRGFVRRAARLKQLQIEEAEHTVLRAILLVEMSARPLPIRVIEWLLFFAGRCVGISRSRLPRTRGPFQILDSPFRFEAAA